MDIVRRLKEQQRSQHLRQPADETTRTERPFLWELLTLACYSNGQQRHTATIKVTRVPGAFRVELQDDESEQKCFTEVQELNYVWDALEALLSDPSVTWLPFKSYKPRHPKPKKKDGED